MGPLSRSSTDQLGLVSHIRMQRGKLNCSVFCQSATPRLTKEQFKNVWHQKVPPEGLGAVR